MLADMAACRLVMVESSNASRTFQTSAWTGPTSFSNQLDWIDIRIAEHTTRIREGLRLVSRPRVAAAASAVDIKAVCPSHWTTASRHDGSPFLGTGAVRVRRRFRLHCETPPIDQSPYLASESCCCCCSLHRIRHT
ncbi:hypothetical protein FALCPG4_001406 [Fusarium falciforme]